MRPALGWYALWAMGLGSVSYHPCLAAIQRNSSRREFVSFLSKLVATGAVAGGGGGRLPAQRNEVPLPLGKANVLFDTDAANYFDDQFALAYAALSRESIQIRAAYAAPFVNRRNGDREEGMERSYEEIGRVLAALGMDDEVPLLKGSRRAMESPGKAVLSPAAEDIVERVMSADPEIHFVVAIGAATNVASALLLEPRVGDRTTIVWLGGTPHHFPSASEFNLRQDASAVRALLNSGARLMHAPAPGLAENLRTTRQELGQRLRGESPIEKHLLGRVDEALASDDSHQGSSRTLALWDMVTVAWLVNPAWVPSVLVPCPVLSEDLKWLHSLNRHRVRVAIRVLRDEVFTDFFQKMSFAPE